MFNINIININIININIIFKKRIELELKKKNKLNINEKSNILFISTEGATDIEMFNKINNIL